MGWGTTNVSAGGGEEDKLKAHLENKNNPHGVTAAQVGARPSTWMPKLQDVAFLGENPIKTTADDTPANWSNVGSGFAWYNTAGLLNNQPGTWGFVVNYVYGSDVFQIWRSQNAGPTYMRSGNASGWAPAWVQVSMDGHTHDDRYYTEAETNNMLAGKANTSHTHSMGDISGLSTALANTSTLKLLAEYKTAGTRNVASLLTGMAFVYAVIVGGGEGGEGGGTGQAYLSYGAKGGDGGNIRIVGPLNVSALTNKTVVVGAGGAGAPAGGGGNNPNHNASPGGTSSAFGFTASGGGNTPAAGEIKGGAGGTNYNTFTPGESLPLIDFFGIKSLSPGGGAGGTHGSANGSASGTSSVGNGGSGGLGVTTQGNGAYGSPGSNGGCTAGGGGGGGGTCLSSIKDYSTERGGKGGDGGPGYVAIYGIPKGV